MQAELSELDKMDQFENALAAANEFTKIYYESLDKRRHLMSKLYTDDATLIWNGNVTKGKDDIQKFFEGLPHTDHNLLSMDTHRIGDEFVNGQSTILITVSGVHKMLRNPPVPFQESFVLTAIANKWKIVSDTFRIQQDYTGMPASVGAP